MADPIATNSTSAEIRARIKILPARQPYPYQRLAVKVAQLRALGMTYRQIADTLHISENTAMRAHQYHQRSLSARPPPGSPPRASQNKARD